MLVISTYGNEPVSHSDILQLEAIFAGLVIEYHVLMSQLSLNPSPALKARAEEQAHETRTIALRVGGLLGQDIRETQEYLSPGGKPYVR